jgi:hypothetical protein
LLPYDMIFSMCHILGLWYLRFGTWDTFGTFTVCWHSSIPDYYLVTNSTSRY